MTATNDSTVSPSARHSVPGHSPASIARTIIQHVDRERGRLERVTALVAGLRAYYGSGNHELDANVSELIEAIGDELGRVCDLLEIQDHAEILTRLSVAKDSAEELNEDDVGAVVELLTYIRDLANNTEPGATDLARASLGAITTMAEKGEQLLRGPYAR
jgi:hypothetical protein